MQCSRHATSTFVYYCLNCLIIWNMMILLIIMFNTKMPICFAWCLLACVKTLLCIARCLLVLCDFDGEWSESDFRWHPKPAHAFLVLLCCWILKFLGEKTILIADVITGTKRHTHSAWRAAIRNAAGMLKFDNFDNYPWLSNINSVITLTRKHKEQQVTTGTTFHSQKTI
jgi:hypothetical protein